MIEKQSNECKVVEVEEIEVTYKINCTMIEPMKLRENRAKEKQELRKMSEEYIAR